MSVAYHNCPVHVFTVYLPPRSDEGVKETKRTLTWHLDSVFRSTPNARVVVMGDFNHLHIKEMQNQLAKLGLLPTIPDN